METNHKLALAVLSGIAIGVAGVTVIQAQQVKPPPAYVVAEPEITDAATFQKYGQGVPATIAAFNGRFLVRGGKMEAVEGDAPKRFVVIAFDSLEKARAWYDSPAYEAIKPLRFNSAKTRLFIVEGITPE
jgi:uncharacterized protein (DUF1330 family)